MVKAVVFAVVDAFAWIVVVRDLRKWRATKVADPSLGRWLVGAVAGVVAVVVLVSRSLGA
jgi:hypothetical protein